MTEVAASEVVIRWCLDTGRWDYRTRCPGCDKRFVAPTAVHPAVEVLRAGAFLETWTMPAELREPVRANGPMSHVDLLELRLALTEPDFVERLDA